MKNCLSNILDVLKVLSNEYGEGFMTYYSTCNLIFLQLSHTISQKKLGIMLMYHLEVHPVIPVLGSRAKYNMSLMSEDCVDQRSSAIYAGEYLSLPLLWNDTKNVATWKVSVSLSISLNIILWGGGGGGGGGGAS